MRYQWPDGTEIRFFSPLEFDLPHLMDIAFIQDLSDLRLECGFAMKITSSVRLDHDMERIYGRAFAECPDSRVTLLGTRVCAAADPGVPPLAPRRPTTRPAFSLRSHRALA